jgi:hypothetical protein
MPGRLLALAAVVLLFSGCRQPPIAGGPAGGARATRLDLRISRLVDLHNLVHVLATEKRDQPRPDFFEPAVRAARAVQDKIGGQRMGWGLIDGYLVDCPNAQELARRLRELPDPYPPRAGLQGELRFRDEAVALAEALAQIEQRYATDLWPARRTELEQAKQQVEQVLDDKEAQCLAFIMNHLGMDDPGIVIPVYLVLDAPWPGGVTYRAPGGAACFIDTRANGPAVRPEIILHEATHALDVATAGHNVFEQLRKRLAEANVPPRQAHDLWHTLMFVQSAETVRRVLDPKHQDYGEVTGYYAKAAVAARAVRPAWIAYLDGRCTRDDAVSRMVRVFSEMRIEP